MNGSDFHNRLSNRHFFPPCHPPILLLGLISTAMAMAAYPVWELKAKDDSSAPGALFHEATDEFDSMKSTGYQHRTEVDRNQGSYYYDCVGFVSYGLKSSTPEAWKTIVRATGIAKGRIPSPMKYVAFFTSLKKNPQPGWEAVPKASELRPGDIVSWTHLTKRANGHALIIADTPSLLPNGEWLVEVYDSTSSAHGNDSRPEDQRTQVLPSTGRRSGLGHGIMVFISDPSTGALSGFRWSPKGKILTVPIAAGRPLF